MKTILTHLIRLKNPDFTFAEGIGFRELTGLVLEKSANLVRGIIGQLRAWKLPRIVFMEAGVTLKHTRRLRLGNWVRLEKQVYLSALGRKNLEIGDRSRIGAFSRLVTGTSYSDPGSHISIGGNVGIGEFAYLGGAGGLEIGDDCIIGQYFSCHPENHNFENPELPIRKQGVNRRGIKIGQNCWIGSKVTILDGVEIGAGCVIAAGAVVTKSMPGGSVIGGVPARVLKKIHPRETPFVELLFDGRRIAV